MAAVTKIDEGNYVDALVSAQPRSKSLKVMGRENTISVGDGSDIRGLWITVDGDRNNIRIGRNCKLRGQLSIKGNDQTVTVGDFTTFVSAYLLCQENCNITIGKWCMFSREIEVRTTDAHSVIDVASGLRINKPGSVTIGDHVWVSLGVVINKNVTIASDNIIAARSFVNKDIWESQTVIAGAPATIVKRGVTWHRQRLSKFAPDKLLYWKSEHTEEI